VPTPPSRPGRRIRRALAAAAAALLLGGSYALVHLGTFLAREDPLTKADAIFVFAGTVAERAMEAADLYREGYAPRIVVTRGPRSGAMVRLEQQGIFIASESDLNRDVLRRLGVPDDVLIMPPRFHDNTADEARTLRALSAQYGWRRIIIVTSKYHVRRAALSVSRALRGTGVQMIRRGSRYDESMPQAWWTRRADIRWLASETPKLLAYGLGLGD